MWNFCFTNDREKRICLTFYWRTWRFSITNWRGAVVLVVFFSFVQMCSKPHWLWKKIYELLASFGVYFFLSNGRANTAQRGKKEAKKRRGNLSFRVELFVVPAFAATKFANGFRSEIDLSTLFSTVVNLLYTDGFKRRLNIFSIFTHTHNIVIGIFTENPCTSRCTFHSIFFFLPVALHVFWPYWILYVYAPAS